MGIEQYKPEAETLKHKCPNCGSEQLEDYMDVFYLCKKCKSKIKKEDFRKREGISGVTPETEEKKPFDVKKFGEELIEKAKILTEEMRAEEKKEEEGLEEAVIIGESDSGEKNNQQAL